MIKEKERGKRMKKKLPWIILGGVAVLVLIPLGVAFILSFSFIVTDTTNEWIGFWGGYLGSILGGVITLFVLWKTLGEEKRAREREETNKYFSDLIKAWSLFEAAMASYQLQMRKIFNSSQYGDDVQLNAAYSQALGYSVELEVLLHIRNSCDGFTKIIEDFDKICNDGSEIMSQYESIRNDEKQKKDKILKMWDELSDKIADLRKKLKQIIKSY